MDSIARQLEGITSPCSLLIGQYPHHMTLCPPVSMVKDAMESVYGGLHPWWRQLTWSGYILSSQISWQV